HNDDTIALVGVNTGEIGGSEYLKEHYNLITGNCPQLNLEIESRLQESCLQAIRAGWIHSAHDISEGGLAVALAECCFLNPKQNLGAEVRLDFPGRVDFGLFGEEPTRIVISFATDNLAQVEEVFRSHDVPLTVIGKVTTDNRLQINNSIDVAVEKLESIYRHAIRRKMEASFGEAGT
ncbi:MAG: AIR synthase-related protein, partial [bacterium]